MKFALSELKQLLVKHEGVRAKPYHDSVGKLTIGVGRNLDDVGLFKDEIDLMLTNDIFRCIDDLNSHLPWWNELDSVRQMVLVNMCFNLGVHGLLGFKNTLESIKTGNYERASQQMLESKWAKQVQGRAVELSIMMKGGE